MQISRIHNIFFWGGGYQLDGVLCWFLNSTLQSICRRHNWLGLAPKYHGYWISVQSYKFYLHLAQLDILEFPLSHYVNLWDNIRNCASFCNLHSHVFKAGPSWVKVGLAASEGYQTRKRTFFFVNSELWKYIFGRKTCKLRQIWNCERKKQRNFFTNSVIGP